MMVCNSLHINFINDRFPAGHVQYIPRNMHTVFALLCFVVVIHWLILPYPPGLLHWHCGNLTIAPVPAKQPWWIWINTSCEFIMNDCITTTKQSTTQPCAYFLGYTVIAPIVAQWGHVGTWILVNIGSGTGDSLLPAGTKPLSEPILTHHPTIPISKTRLKICVIKTTSRSPRDHWVKI